MLKPLPKSTPSAEGRSNQGRGGTILISFAKIKQERAVRAQALAAAGSLDAAIDSGAIKKFTDLTLSEALVLGLLKQGVRNYLTVLGHGSTEVGEVLRVYAQAGLVRVCGVRSEIEASHAAAALRWIYGEKAAVVTSIGPGALQALAASIVPASDGIGVWYLFGDETTEDEGMNMQQIPKQEQGLFLRICATMGQAYSLHTPLALPTALERGLLTVDHPYRPGPFFLLMPMNTQASLLKGFNLDELPCGTPPGVGAAVEGQYKQAANQLLAAKKVVVKIGGGARGAGKEILELIEMVNGVVVHNPIASGIVPYHHPRNMTVGGSKGSISGNYAMENADLLLAVGTRAVCQSDSSRTGYPNVKTVININADPAAALHYRKTIALVGDAALTLRNLIGAIKGYPEKSEIVNSSWYQQCSEKRKEWDAHKAERYTHPVLYDECWGREVLTQPAAIKTATDWARENDVVTLFDAGDVQANGFQIAEDDRIGRTYTETGASYMGFAASALLAAALAKDRPYALAISGDGSFTMNPQILIDGVEHKARGCILLLDNRRMAAISGLQLAQYGSEFVTKDSVQVDYAAWARSVQGMHAFGPIYSLQSLQTALNEAKTYDGLSLIHVPVYFGTDELGGLGAFGRWNVGSWCESTQALRHQIGL